ncbi:MAG: CpsB/CapC family capsule biosynthesis tyrosine phosphatase [Gemmatimonadaceae bacterium]
MLDFHNHLMPAVDDGAADIEEARTGLSVLSSQGVDSVITTPHLRASMIDRPSDLEAYLDALDNAWDALKTLATAEFPQMRLERGAEIMLDVPKPDLSDERLRLAGTSFVLIEFPFMTIPPHSTLALREIVRQAWIPVIAHPERYRNIPTNYGLVEDWRDSGARIQVNEGSFVGFYGAAAKSIAWTLLQQGSVDYLASDYHCRGKCAVRPCAEAFARRGAETQLRALTATNPERLLCDELPLPVPPLLEQSTALWRRLLPRSLR